jgi:hypothetical protein
VSNERAELYDHVSKDNRSQNALYRISFKALSGEDSKELFDYINYHPNKQFENIVLYKNMEITPNLLKRKNPRFYYDDLNHFSPSDREKLLVGLLGDKAERLNAPAIHKRVYDKLQIMMIRFALKNCFPCQMILQPIREDTEFTEWVRNVRKWHKDAYKKEKCICFMHGVIVKEEMFLPFTIDIDRSKIYYFDIFKNREIHVVAMIDNAKAFTDKVFALRKNKIRIEPIRIAMPEIERQVDSCIYSLLMLLICSTCCCHSDFPSRTLMGVPDDGIELYLARMRYEMKGIIVNGYFSVFSFLKLEEIDSDFEAKLALERQPAKRKYRKNVQTTSKEVKAKHGVKKERKKGNGGKKDNTQLKRGQKEM